MIKLKAKIDMPLYNIKAGQVVEGHIVIASPNHSIAENVPCVCVYVNEWWYTIALNNQFEPA